MAADEAAAAGQEDLGAGQVVRVMRTPLCR